MATRIDISELETALEGLLESALVPGSWERTLEQISQATSSVGTHIMPVRGKFPSGFLSTPNLLEAFQVYFAEEWYKRDFRERGLAVAMTKGVIIEHDIAGEEEFDHHSFYTEFLARFGLRYSAMVGFTAGDTMLSLNLQRRIKDQPFDHDDERLLVKMQSRLTAAAEIIRALHVAKIDSMSEAFELAGTAVIFFDRAGRITRLNQRAEKLLDGNIRILDRELVGISQEETGALRRHLQAILSKEPFANPLVSTPVLLSRPGKAPLVVRAQRLNGVTADLFSHSAAVAIITDLSERATPSRDLLRRLFALTPQETTVARLLMEGSSPRQIAEISGLSYETTRGYVKRVLAKTGTQRQSQLISLLSSLKI
ncbi:DNA-binding CsgD family transcriptional regulator/PAS domain-containing protein [Rhizobium sp. BK529]|uniref:helix-turn-helix transcriptional regulator n=1 Tax=unclassified Rhizobium TaxID=2613769 RepID=UPI0010446641|nr:MULTISPECIES: LuxR C-terminal-related transcriptional regulator [unclassified Rhizobium]MBB3595345.1 DNA-binding CsgD family transcriptional regulator/PAS domain-containing protein [Rhizobium sp. BK529]TCS00862.1 DNA-binding CsgD family transcriptional regulator [Rhizobium sp. BK418]